MMQRFLSLAALALAVCPHTSSAQMADVICDESQRLEQQLRAHRDTKPLGHGLRDPDTLMQVWVTPGTGAWVIVQRYANGTSCIVAMGENWENAQTAADPA